MPLKSSHPDHLCPCCSQSFQAAFKAQELRIQALETALLAQRSGQEIQTPGFDEQLEKVIQAGERQETGPREVSVIVSRCVEVMDSIERRMRFLLDHEAEGSMDHLKAEIAELRALAFDSIAAALEREAEGQKLVFPFVCVN